MVAISLRKRRDPSDVECVHRTSCRRSEVSAREIGIRLEFISPGMTAECQPLARRIVRNLKDRARRRFNDYWTVNQSSSIEDSIAILLDAWKSISQDEVLDAWDLETA
jgi:hypothetical protein